MKRSYVLVVTVIVLALLSSASKAIAQEPTPFQPSLPQVGAGPQTALGTAFTYQGQLKNNGAPVNATCDIVFGLYDAPNGGTQIGYAVGSPNPTTVTNGLFTVQVDFGANVLKGDAAWLSVLVRCPSGGGNFTPLNPLQPLTPAPYALGLRAGTIISGTAYQNLKVVSYAPTGGVPAGVTGEMYAATDGVGVYGANSITTPGGNGIGVWGRTWSPNGSGVRGSGLNGADGVHGDSTNGIGVNGLSSSGIGVRASSVYTGVYGIASGTGGYGVYGESTAASFATGVLGKADNASCGTNLMSGYCSGASGYSSNGNGVLGQTSAGVGVYALSNSGVGVRVEGQSGNLIEAYTGPVLENRRFYVSNAGAVYADGTFNPGGADMAEMLAATGDLEAGDVLVIGLDGKLIKSAQPYQSNVAGIYSTKPGFLGGAGDGADPTGKIPLAVVGVVPVKATAQNGAIHAGDLLTTSDTPGHAMKATPVSVNGITFYPSGVIIGKALGSLASGTGVIQMLVTLQYVGFQVPEAIFVFSGPN